MLSISRFKERLFQTEIILCCYVLDKYSFRMSQHFLKRKNILGQKTYIVTNKSDIGISPIMKMCL